MLKSKVVIKQPKIVWEDLSDDNVVGYALQDGSHIAEIDPNQTDREVFLTVFHELMHLNLPDLKEKYVSKLEKTSGLALWKIVLLLKRSWTSRKITKVKKKHSKN